MVNGLYLGLHGEVQYYCGNTISQDINVDLLVVNFPLKEITQHEKLIQGSNKASDEKNKTEVKRINA